MDFAIDFRLRFPPKNNQKCFENRSRRVPGASRMAPGGLRESSRHASVISVRFCALKVIWGLEVLATLGLKVAPGRSPKIDQKSTFCEKGHAMEGIFLDFCRVCCFSRFFLRFRLDFEWKIAVFSNAVSSRSCLLYTSPSPRDATLSRMPSSA